MKKHWNITLNVDNPKKNIDFKEGEIILPTSKSLSNRALIIRELCSEKFEIKNLSDSDDTQNLLYHLETDNRIVDIGAAGTNMRFLISLYSYLPGIKTITGSERMLQRPVGELVSALNFIGAKIEYLGKQNYPPIEITGRSLQGGKIQIPGNISSQFISSLLMISPVMDNGAEIEIVGEMVSRPYIQMTLDMMEYFGIKYTWIDQKMHIQPQTYIPKPYTVEGDWSAAGFWYGFIACSEINTGLYLKNITSESLQGDKKTADYFKKLGVTTTPEGSGIRIQKQTKHSESLLEFNLINEPDLFPALAFTCATLHLKARFTGLETLNLKESKRVETIAKEIGKTGAISIYSTNELEITEFKDSNLECIFETYHDHRIAMAAAIYSMSGNTIKINDPEVVSKSYPHYWSDLQKIAIVNIY